MTYKTQVKQEKHKTLLVVAADSGGHILPGLTLARHWLHDEPAGRVVFVSNNTQLDKSIIQNAGWVSKHECLSLDKFIVSKVTRYPKLIFQVIRALVKSFCIIKKYKPEKIITTGGLVALPVCLMGRLMGYHVDVYELNAVPGKAVQGLMFLAHTIFILFKRTKDLCRWGPLSFAHKCFLTHYPIRFETSDREGTRHDACDLVNKQMGNTGELFSEARKTIFILGGSQGSVLLNTCIKNFFEQNLPVLSLVQVIHQIGAQDQFDWVGFYKNMRVPAFVFSYNEDLAACYRATDVIVCRAGAGTLFEVLFFNKRALVVPLVAQTTSHQVDNAQALAQEHLELFTVVLQQDIIQDQKIFNNTLKILLEVNKI